MTGCRLEKSAMADVCGAVYSVREGSCASWIRVVWVLSGCSYGFGV